MQHKIYHFKILASTQDKAKEFSKKGLSNIVVISGSQTKGRGRFSRKWHSDKNGLYMSVLLKPDNIQKLQYLTFAAAVSVVQSIKTATGISTKIKWPNDVHYNGKKLSGILTEGIFGKENYVAIGIGLNVNQDRFPREIENIATSLRMIKKEKININKLTNKIVQEFFDLYYKQYRKNKFGKILKSWKKYCDTIGKNVAVISKTKKIYGNAIGVDGDCNLLLKLKSNKIIKIVEGDVKVRY